MLFGYPVEATRENWLHECLCEMLRSIHNAIDANDPPPAWPDIIPAAYCERLRTYTGLRDRLDRYTVAVLPLAAAGRKTIIRALEEQNDIQGLVSRAHDCEVFTKLPKAAREPLKNLFISAFTSLTGLGIRDRQYRIVYSSLPHHVCPFCGCEFLDAPGAPREALDHYLAKSLYPLAAVNLTNLVFMGNKCNSNYKRTKDILRKADGTRRRAFDPYNCGQTKVSLTASAPFGGELVLQL